MLSSISTLFADLLYEITEHISSVDFLQKKKKKDRTNSTDACFSIYCT